MCSDWNFIAPQDIWKSLLYFQRDLGDKHKKKNLRQWLSADDTSIAKSAILL